MPSRARHEPFKHIAFERPHAQAGRGIAPMDPAPQCCLGGQGMGCDRHPLLNPSQVEINVAPQLVLCPA